MALGNAQQGKRWVFTWHFDTLEDAIENFSYLPLGPTGEQLGAYGGAQVEVAPTTGKPHIQGWFGFKTNKRKGAINRLLGDKWNELMRGKISDNIRYCSKSATSVSDYFTWGEIPEDEQGKRNDIEALVATVRDTTGSAGVRIRAAATEHGSAFVKYHRGVEALARHYADELVPEPEPIWRPWQLALKLDLEGPADKRKIIWIYDQAGGAGKSTFVTWFLTNNRQAIELDGKVADMATMCHHVEEHYRLKYVFFDITRTQEGQMDHLYKFAERMKDRKLTVTKFMSTSVVLKELPHVVFFSNSLPDMTKWTPDRYDIRDVSGAVAPAFEPVALPMPGAAAGGAGAPGGEPRAIVDLTQEGEAAYYADLLEGF